MRSLNERGFIHVKRSFIRRVGTFSREKGASWGWELIRGVLIQEEESSIEKKLIHEFKISHCPTVKTEELVKLLLSVHLPVYSLFHSTVFFKFITRQAIHISKNMTEILSINCVVWKNSVKSVMKLICFSFFL